MSIFNFEETAYSVGERIVIAIISFIVFAIIGAIARLFYAPVVLIPITDLIIQFLPFMLLFGIIASALAYAFPKLFSIILCFLPIPGGNN